MYTLCSKIMINHTKSVQNVKILLLVFELLVARSMEGPGMPEAQNDVEKNYIKLKDTTAHKDKFGLPVGSSQQYRESKQLPMPPTVIEKVRRMHTLNAVQNGAPKSSSHKFARPRNRKRSHSDPTADYRSTITADGRRMVLREVANGKADRARPSRKWIQEHPMKDWGKIPAYKDPPRRLQQTIGSKVRSKGGIRVFHHNNPPPSCRNLVKTRGGFLWSNLENFEPIFAESPLKIHKKGSKTVKIFRLRQAFPLVNMDFGVPKAQIFRLRRFCPLNSPKSDPERSNSAKSGISQNLSSRKQGGVYWVGGVYCGEIP